MQNDIIELMLWNNRFHVAQCILSQLACIYGNEHFSKMFIGKYSGYYSIGDNNNVFSCNMIFASIPDELVKNSKEFDLYKGPITLNMFKPIEQATKYTIDDAMHKIFKEGNSLVLWKNRWAKSGEIVIKNCYSMLDACKQIGIDIYRLLVQLDLNAIYEAGNHEDDCLSV